MACVRDLSAVVGIARACEVLAVPRASFYRWQAPDPDEAGPRPSPPRSLSAVERQVVLSTLNSSEFCDKAPAEVYASLLDRGTYLCSIRTMYRVLEKAGEVRERRDQLRHPTYRKPELLATGPNQVWSWDITKLLGPVKWTYFYLYVIIDIYSRYVVGWLLADRESTSLAKRLIAETVAKEGVDRGHLVIHSDRGSSMRSKPVAQLLADLGVTKSHSRPHVSDDNPFSESQFKTLKYHPEFPDSFGSQEDARTFCRRFFTWYNDEHYHSGIALLTPSSVHHGRADQVVNARREILRSAYTQHPERFVLRPPAPQEPPKAVWINPPASGTPERLQIGLPAVQAPSAGPVDHVPGLLDSLNASEALKALPGLAIEKGGTLAAQRSVPVTAALVAKPAQRPFDSTAGAAITAPGQIPVRRTDIVLN
jgi:putative transposase